MKISLYAIAICALLSCQEKSHGNKPVTTDPGISDPGRQLAFLVNPSEFVKSVVLTPDASNVGAVAVKHISWTFPFSDSSHFQKPIREGCRLHSQRLVLPEISKARAIGGIFNPEVVWDVKPEFADQGDIDLFEISFSYKIRGDDKIQSFNIPFSSSNLENISGVLRSEVGTVIHWDANEIKGVPEWVEFSVCKFAANVSVKSDSIGLKVYRN